MIALNFGFGPLEHEFWRLMFAMTRIGAAMLAAPFFGAGNVPPQVRVIATGAIAVLVCAWTPIAAPPAMLSLQGLMLVLGEVLVGLSLGFVLQLAFAAPVIGAEMIGGAMGMAMATSVDPHSGAHSPALGQYFAVVLTLVFFASGGHLQWIALVLESYRSFPPGETWVMAARAPDIAAFGTQMLATAVAIALPVTLVLLLVQILTGVLGRSAPALNLFALGLPAGIVAGLAALILSAPLFTDILSEVSAQAIAATKSIALR
ncbi:MAG: flagellar biosynthetic protein FliR [Novosphingobium sp.]